MLKVFGAAVVAALASLCLVASGALAAPTSFVRVGAFAEQGPDGELHHSERIAVQQSTGLVFRTESVSDRVGVYRPNGTGADELTSFGAGEVVDPFGIAVDQTSGAVYVADAGNNRIVRYVGDGGDPPVYTLDATFTSPALGSAAAQVGSFAAAIAVDPVSQDLLVADPGNDLVKRYDNTGAYLGSFDGAGSPAVFTGLQDLAVDSTGDVIVIDSDGSDPADGGVSRVERFGADGTWESTIGPVAGAAAVAVRPVNDEVVVSGNQDAVNRDETPTLFVFDALTSRQLTIDGSAAFSTVSGIAIGGGLAGRLYVATDTSRGAYPASYGLASVQVYIPPDPPVIDEASVQALAITATDARLTFLVDPQRAGTTVRVEYGTTTAYGQTSADIDVGAGDAPKRVSHSLEGLQPSTVYHYRVVADNGVGAPVAGQDHTLTTDPPVPEAGIGVVSNLTMTSVTVSGTVDTRGLAGVATFSVVQTGGGYSTATPAVALSAADGPQAVTAEVGGLPAGGTFALRLAASTAGGTGIGELVRFSTVARPVFVAPALPVPFGIGDAGYGCQAPVLDCGSHPIVAVPVSPPSNSFAIVKTTVRGSTATLMIKVPGAGTLRATGRRLKAVSRRVSAKGNATFQLRLSAAGVKALRSVKRLTATARVTYTPTGGTSTTVTRTITFKRGSNR